jgi:hypothetical protein
MLVLAPTVLLLSAIAIAVAIRAPRKPRSSTRAVVDANLLEQHWHARCVPNRSRDSGAPNRKDAGATC